MRELMARIAADLAAEGAQFAVVGGHAVSARTEPRFTRDIDLAVAVAGDRQAESLVGRLVQRGFRIVALVEQEATGRLATVRLEHGATPGQLVDLLFATAGNERELVASAQSLRVMADLELPVASTGHLLALKTLSLDDRTRPQDRIDVLALLRVASDGDLEEAERALTLIAQRGANRGRDLLAHFAGLRAQAKG
jgi:hypothetical protein